MRKTSWDGLSGIRPTKREAADDDKVDGSKRLRCEAPGCVSIKPTSKSKPVRPQLQTECEKLAEPSVVITPSRAPGAWKATKQELVVIAPTRAPTQRLRPRMIAGGNELAAEATVIL